jgi:hypothetical protein
MKKVIELLEDAEFYLCEDKKSIPYQRVHDAIDILVTHEPITPDQYRELEGEEYPENGAVYLRTRECGEWSLSYDAMAYWRARTRYIKGWAKDDYILVCAYNLKGPPDADWLPE